MARADRRGDGCRLRLQTRHAYAAIHRPDIVRVARRGDTTQAEVVGRFAISVESVRWVREADVDDGAVEGQISGEQNELLQLRRDKRRLEMENEMLRRAAAYSAAAAYLYLSSRRGSRSDGIGLAPRTATSSMLSPPASIEPMGVTRRSLESKLSFSSR